MAVTFQGLKSFSGLVSHWRIACAIQDLGHLCTACCQDGQGRESPHGKPWVGTVRRLWGEVRKQKAMCWDTISLRYFWGKLHVWNAEAAMGALQISIHLLPDEFSNFSKTLENLTFIEVCKGFVFGHWFFFPFHFASDPAGTRNLSEGQRTARNCQVHSEKMSIVVYNYPP